MSEPLCPQADWDRSYAQLPLAAAGPDDPLRRWLEERFRGRRGTCFELGCYPGRFLAVFGELGYELHGIDLTPHTTDLGRWLGERGHRVGGFVRGDFFTHPLPQRYDVVCSFGVIEHFEDWPVFLARQASLVAPGGLLVVTAPNFRGFVQRAIHACLDRPNYQRHCLDAMRPAAWAAQLPAENWTIREHGGLGAFEYWIEPGPRSRLVRAGLEVAGWLREPGRRWFPRDALWCSPYLRLLAQRRE